MLVGLLAGACLPLSDAPRPMAWLLAFALPAHAGWQALRDWREPPATLVWRSGDVEAHWVQGARTQRLSSLNVRWRGPLATLGARDEAGKLRRLSWWPDTLPSSARRALRLVADASAQRTGAVVAPGAATTLST